MTKDSMALLREAVTGSSQAAVARELGYSPSAINQALKGRYGGSLDTLLERVREIYGSGNVKCPVMGEITLRRCGEERRKHFGVTNPQRVRLYQACQTCEARSVGGRSKAEG